nr:MAG TPA: Neck appendage protein [Caudoviricetes sp.]
MKLNFNATYIDIIPTDESYRYRSIMGEHTLTLYFSLSTYTEIPTGAWCEFANERYTLNQPAKIVKHNTRNFEYTLTMDSEGANLKNYKFRNPNDKTLKFPFTASPRYHVQILVDCLNMIDSGWQVGNCIEASEKLVSYNHNNCLEALEMIAKAFETEYEIIGKTIHLHKVEYFKNNPLPLQYGKGKGFKTGVSRTTEQSRITRLYVQGGDRNIDRSKYGNKELLLPKSQEYVYEGVTFISDDKGLSIAIKNVQNNGFVNEQSLDLSHIYPKRKGTISGFFAVDIDKHFYDIFDDSIPQALDFNAMQIKGEKMLIYFESGMLSGREFEVSHYNHAEKRFQLVPKEEDGVTMPNDIFRPNIGDEYSVYNMQMPNAYISDNATKSGASWEMMKEACKYLYENRTDLFTFTGDLDGIYAKKHWATIGGRLKMGAYINFSDTEFQRTPVAIRIVGIKEYVNNPYSPQIELSNKVQGHSFVSEMRKLQNQEVYFGELNKRTQSLTKRSWRDAQETIKQIEAAFPEYTKSIVPATVQTMMALIGNKSTQFDFVVSKTNPIKAPHTLYFDKNTKQINAGSGWLKHFTLGTTDINPNRNANSYKYWNIPTFVSGRLDDKAKTYYLYIKASKTAETGEFILSENKIDIEQEAGFYHFLYATVNSEYEGDRGIAKLNGFTEITGGQIKTDKITSGNGEQYIHLFDDHIEIKANLKITDGNKTEIKQLVSPDLLSLENRLKSSIRNIQIGGRNLITDSKNERYKEYKGTVEDYIYYGIVGGTLEKNTTYTLSLEYKSENVRSIDLFFINDGITQTPNKNIPNTNGEWKRETFTFTTQPNLSPKGSIRIDNNGSDTGNVISKLWTRNVKLEKGNIATDWTPAPEDLESQISTAKTATEAYARTQAELTKAQAIAAADGKITEAEQRQIQQLQLKLQEAKNFAQQKVNELNIGGRNLLRETKEFIVNGQPYYMDFSWSRNTGEPINERFNGNVVRKINGDWQGVKSNMPDIIGEPVIISFWAKTNGKGNFGNFANKNKNPNHIENFTKYSNDSVLINDNQWHRYTIYNPKGMCLGEGISNGFIEFYNVSGDIYYSSIKIEKGNKPTDWSPAPEDIENKVADIQTDLTTAINNAKAQIEAEKRNIENSNARIQKLENKTQIFSDTQIDGNVVATGTLIVGNTEGTKAGITGMGMTNDSIRFWAGEPDKTQPIETPQQAEQRRRQSAFLVQEDGTLITKNIKAEGGIISGRLKMTSGSIYSGDWDERQNRVISGSAYTGSGVIYREDENDIQAFFGGIASNTYTATKSLLSLYRSPKKPKGVGSIGKFTGVNISIPPNPNDVIDTISYENNRAQIINGDTISLGANAQFEYVYNGIAESSTIKRWLGITNKFVFRDVASDRHIVYLPNYFEVLEIMRKLGFNIIGRQSLSLSFELTVVMGMFVGGKMIRLQGVSSGSIIDNNGGAYNGGDGYIDMGKGDVVVLRLLGGEYHVVNTRFE